MVEPGIYTAQSVLLIGVGLLIVVTIGTVGLVLVGGRWAHRSLLIALGATLVLAASRPVDPIGIAALSFTGAGLVALFSPRQFRLVRNLPAAGGPPPKAVAVAILSLAAPLAIGLIPTEPNPWAMGFSSFCVLSGFFYSRTVPGGLALLRIGVPLAALTLALPMGTAHAVTAIGLALIIAILSWSKDAAVAFRPLIERGTTYAIPPELAPKEVLDRAGVDERGKPI